MINFAHSQNLSKKKTNQGPEPGLPSLCPLTRLVEPHCFRDVAPYRNNTEPGLPSLYPLTRLVEPHYFRTVALFKKSCFLLCGCRGGCRLTAPLEPSTKSLSNGEEILLFERGEPRASYKISCLKVIFVAPWHRAGAPPSLPVNTISLSHTVCALPRSCAPFFGTFLRPKKYIQKQVIFVAPWGGRFLVLFPAGKSTPLPGAGPSGPRGSASPKRGTLYGNLGKRTKR